jgi:hypothetical protein
MERKDNGGVKKIKKSRATLQHTKRLAAAASSRT